MDAVNLRKAGRTYDDIGIALGISKSAAHQLVSKWLHETHDKLRESAQELRTIEANRLDEMQAAIYPQALKGDLLAVDRCVKISAARRALFGLDAPTKVETTGKDGGPIQVAQAVFDAKKLSVAELEQFTSLFERASTEPESTTASLQHLAVAKGNGAAKTPANGHSNGKVTT